MQVLSMNLPMIEKLQSICDEALLQQKTAFAEGSVGSGLYSLDVTGDI